MDTSNWSLVARTVWVARYTTGGNRKYRPRLRRFRFHRPCHCLRLLSRCLRSSGTTMMIETHILDATRQRWKLIVNVAIGVLMLAVFLGVQLFGHHLAEGWRVGLMLSTSLLGIAGLTFAAMEIRRPNCGARWYWNLLREGKIGHRVDWVSLQSKCPKCGMSSERLASLKRWPQERV